MTVILPHKVVQIGLIEILVAIDGVEGGRETKENEHGPEGEADAVPGEEAILGDDGVVGIATLGDQLSVAVNEEEEDEAEDNRVDLEVDREAEEDPTQIVPLLQYEVDRDVDESLDDLII